MKLPASLIFHALTDRQAVCLPQGLSIPTALSSQPLTDFQNTSPISTDSGIFYPRPVFFPDQLSEPCIILYEGNGQKIAHYLHSEDFLICTEWQSSPDFSSGSSCMTVIAAKECSIGSICNLLHNLFNQWEQWESHMQQLLIQEAPLKTFLTSFNHMLKRSITLMNHDYQLVETVYTPGMMDEIGLTEVKVNERLPVDIINAFKMDPFFLQIRTEERVFLYTNIVHLPVPVLCANIVFKNTFLARIVMFGSKEGFSPWEAYFLEKFAEYLRPRYIRKQFLSIENSQTEKIFQKLLNDQHITQPELRTLLSSKQWNLSDRYQLITIHGSAQDIANKTIHYFHYQIMQEFPTCLSSETDNSIILLVNLTNLPSYEQFRQRFSLLIREGNFRAGFSNPFSSLEQVSIHYTQAQIAMQYGSQKNPTIWIHFFNEYAFQYFLDKGTEEIPGRQLCAQELHVLEQYDRDNHTELYRTLKNYLNNRQNASLTARELYIQRGTLLYRLNRIQELTGIDWEDARQILYIQISLILNES